MRTKLKRIDKDLAIALDQFAVYETQRMGHRVPKYVIQQSLGQYLQRAIKSMDKKR